MKVLLAALVATVLGAEPTQSPPEAPPPGTLTRAPELLEFVPAEYPPEAQAAGVEGAVVLSIVIGADGTVQQATVTDPGPHPAFAAAALHAVAQFRFRPAEIDGVPTAVEIEYRYEFVLKKVAPAAPAQAPVVLEGRVIERGTRAPVAGATIEAEGAAVESAKDGRFALRAVLAPGDVIVRIVSPEHEPLSVTERIEEGRRREVEYRLSRRRYDPYEAIVRGERPRREVTVRTLETEEVRTIPGTQGDTLKVIQNLPGVARAPFGIGLLVVRGSEPSETNVYVDGMPIPLLFHFGALTSVVNADVVEAIDFYPGNFATRYGRALGGVVELRTREARRELHGAAQVDLYDGRAEVEGPVGGGSIYAAVRRSWIDGVLAVVLPRVAPETANELRVAPRYYDYQTKLSFPAAGGVASVFAYGSDDLLTFVRSQDAPGRPTFKLSTLFHRGGASYRRAFGPATNDLVFALGRDSIDVLRGGAFGLLTETRALSARDALTWKVSEKLSLELGADVLVRHIEYSVYAAPARSPGSVDDPLQETPVTVAETESGYWLSPAAYAEATFAPASRLRLVAGLRADWETRFGRRKSWLDPRVAAFLDVRPGTVISAGAGIFGSPPQPQDTSPTFGNPNLDPARALHLSLGVAQALPWASRVEVTGFYKRMWDLVVPTRLDDAEGNPLRLSNEGRGRTFGMELLLRRELARGLFGWLAWTWSRSERIDDPSVSPYEWHLFPLDQTHVVALILSYRLKGDWILGTRIRAVSGNPITPAEGAVLDADTGRVQCLPSTARFSQRLPGFFQADARVDKRFVFDAWMLSAYLDVQNVTNRENAEFRFQNYNCTEQAPLPSIPIFPAVGLRAEW